MSTVDLAKKLAKKKPGGYSRFNLRKDVEAVIKTDEDLQIFERLTGVKLKRVKSQSLK